MRWGGAGLTALLAVLFLVLLQQVRQQGQRLQTLQDRVQALENARDLERTDALEEQVRSTVRRLQGLEALRGAVQRLRSEQDTLRQQIRANHEASGTVLPEEPLIPPAQPQP
jgi:predicted  nucleic acid-binding Zn-ribbon protein